MKAPARWLAAPLLVLLLVGGCSFFRPPKDVPRPVPQEPTPGAWTEHPNTNFSTWAKASGLEALHEACGPSSSVGAIISGWNSGAYHAGLDAWLNLRGGGHADGCLNAVVALMLGGGAPQWSLRVTPSNAAPKMIGTPPVPDDQFKVVYPDGTPSSVHGYGGTFVITSGPLAGTPVSSGGIFWSRPGNSVPEAVFTVDLSKTTAATAWTRKANRPGGYGVTTTWNPHRNRALLILSGEVTEWEPVADTYTRLFAAGTGTSTGNSSIALTSDGTRAYVVAQGTPGTRLKFFDYATAATTRFQTLTTTGGEGLENLPAVGLFSVGGGRLVGMGQANVTLPPVPPSTTSTTATRMAIFTLVDDGVCGRGTAAPCAWQRVTPKNPTTNLPPAPASQGMWGRHFIRGCDIWSVATPLGNVWSFRPEFAMESCAPIVVKVPLTITAPVGGGTGQSTPPEGTHQVERGSVQTLNFAALTGSFVGWQGDADCEDGEVTMTTARTCTPVTEPPDVTAPTVQITSPAVDSAGRPRLYGGVVPLTYTASDNVGISSAVVTLDGQVMTGTTIDTATMANGSYHDVVVRVLDAAGNSAQDSASFIAFNCPVCPPPKPVAYALTVAKAGTGDGTVGGGGEYEAGAPVTLTAAPNVESTEGAWSPAPCAATFPMPAQALTCVKTFTLKPPPDPGPTLPPARVWRLVPEPKATDAATARVGKHFRCAKDTKRGTLTCIGGDRVALPYNPASAGGEQSSDAGNPAVTSLDAKTGVGTILSPMCPAAPATMPAFPDNAVVIYDTKRDLYRVYRGFFFGQFDSAGNSQTNRMCKRDPYPSSPVYDPNVLHQDVLFDPTTRTWAPAPWPKSPYGYGSDGGGPTFGVYDEVTDADYMFRKDGGWGAVLLILRHATNTWQAVKLGNYHASGSEQRDLLRNAVVYRSSPAVLDGWLYVHSPRGANSALLAIHLANPDSMGGQIAYRMPASYSHSPIGSEEIEGYVLALPWLKRIVHPLAPGLTAALRSLYIFDPASKTWAEEAVPVPPDVRETINGGNWTVNPETEEIISLGRRIIGFRGYGTWRYRYTLPSGPPPSQRR